MKNAIICTSLSIFSAKYDVDFASQQMLMYAHNLLNESSVLHNVIHTNTHTLQHRLDLRLLQLIDDDEFWKDRMQRNQVNGRHTCDDRIKLLFISKSVATHAYILSADYSS